MDVPQQLDYGDSADIFRSWMDAVLSTQPIDRAETWTAICDLYRVLELHPPRHMLVVESPRQAILSGRLIALPGRSLRSKFLPSVLQSLMDMRFRKGPAGGVRTEVERLVMEGLVGPVRQALSQTAAIPASPGDLARLRQAAQTAGFDGRFRSKRQTSAQTDLSLSQSFDFALAIGVLAQLRFLQGSMPGLLANVATPLVAAVDRVCRACPGPVWFLTNVAIVTERPQWIAARGTTRRVAVDGPLLTWRDGFTIRARQGLIVPTWLDEAPEKVGVADIENETNVELRRLLLETMGAERYLKESGAVRIAEDETGVLWQRRIPDRRRVWPRLQPITFVEVVNGTPEPDGSFRRYFLRVPPEMRTAREAVAWTYGFEASRYRPAIRT